MPKLELLHHAQAEKVPFWKLKQHAAQPASLTTCQANLVGWRDKPVALSIVQARVVGLAHFTIGYILTYAAFLIASTSGKFG